ncbi:MAG: helix-turn-helix transcriptional regulator [Chloroflexi bacterium]|nr:helix-turn-helix transcriptional regulator [Chloroflexota bacterium]
MSNIAFGKQLRAFRLQCHDPVSGKPLSQQRLGDLLGEEMGAGFSGAAVSDWERGESKIHVDDRHVLISLLKVLNKTGGLKTSSEANLLLEAGNYRALNPDEKQRVFPGEESKPADGESKPLVVHSPYGGFLSDGFQKLLDEAREGPSPAWTRVVTALLRRLSDRVSVPGVFRGLIWFWIWIASYLMLAPLLYGFFYTPETVLVSIVEYVCASLILPLCVGMLTNTRDNPFWQQDEEVSSLVLRLYTHQGAYVGFHIGYFIVFALRLLAYSLQVKFSLPTQFILVGLPLFLGNVASQVVPYNLWRAYGRLRLSDGAIFFVFVPLGFLWGWFLFQFHPVLMSPTSGIIVTLAAITLLVSMMTLQYRRKGNTVIPAHWWIILYGLILVCEIVLALTR